MMLSLHALCMKLFNSYRVKEIAIEALVMCWQAYTFVEFFAGKAACSRAVKSAGYPTASLDVIYWETMSGKQNPMDILTPSGMAFLVGHYM